MSEVGLKDRREEEREGIRQLVDAIRQAEDNLDTARAELQQRLGRVEILTELIDAAKDTEADKE